MCILPHKSRQESEICVRIVVKLHPCLIWERQVTKAFIIRRLFCWMNESKVSSVNFWKRLFSPTSKVPENNDTHFCNEYIFEKSLNFYKLPKDYLLRLSNFFPFENSNKNLLVFYSMHKISFHLPAVPPQFLHNSCQSVSLFIRQYERCPKYNLV